MAQRGINSPRYSTTDDDRKNIHSGFEALGPDLVPAWRDLGKVDSLCGRCEAIPWLLFQFEEHDFEDPAWSYTTSGSSSDDSFNGDMASLNDFYATHRWEKTKGHVDGRHREGSLDADPDSRSDTSTSPRQAFSERDSPPPSGLDTQRPFEGTKTDSIESRHRQVSSTGSSSERSRGSAGRASLRQTEYDSTLTFNDRPISSLKQCQFDQSLTPSIGRAKSEDSYRYTDQRRNLASVNSVDDPDLAEDGFRFAHRRNRSPSSHYGSSSGASFQYFGHIFRPHVSRPDPLGPYIKFWNRGNCPSLADVREAAHQGCHLCSLILASLLVGRSNRVFGTSLDPEDATEVFDYDEILMYGRVYKSKSDGSYSRYLQGCIKRMGFGPFGLGLRFSVLDEKLGHTSSTVCPEVTVATQAEAIAKFWLHDCLTNHQCNRDQTRDPLLPSRVIDVRGVEGGRELFLLESNGIRAKYAALSYCWGQCELLRTTEATYAERCLSIPLHTLPRTFKDAVSMTTALGLQYLWIDALCIIQDSADDCQRELGSMAEIYADSTVTIAAIGATSADSGFPLSRNKLTMVDCRVSPDTVISADFMGQDYILDSGTVHSRAWCFQEVQLAPRLLSCGAKELYFQCHRGLRREGRPSELLSENEKEKSESESDGGTPDRRRFCDYQPMTDPSEIYKIWYKCVRAYTQLGLTYSTDKLTALSGLASRLPRLFEEDADRPTPQDYVAGLWRADLLTGLLRENIYNHPQQRQPVMFRAPSWSWAATEAQTWCFRTQAREFCCEVLEATVTPVSELNPFGPVRSGKITLCGPVAPLPALAFYQDEFDSDPANKNRRAVGNRVVSWDYEVSRDLGCVCLLFTANDALVLTPVRRPGARTGVFQRAGILDGLQETWKRDLLGGEAVDASDFDWKPGVVTII
jgi:hypothetical protein